MRSDARASLILASTSPRRIDLMRRAGFDPIVEAPDVDESPRPGESPRSLVARLAREKASSVARRKGRSSGGLVIAADTIVVAPGGREILGKPSDAREARRMLARLAGRMHTVLTGYCILEIGSPNRRERKPVVRVVRSTVKMRKLTAREIRLYVATGEPMDKAGSYAAQGIGMALIEEIRGSYANVVGLPICQLVLDLEAVYGVALFSGPAS